MNALKGRQNLHLKTLIFTVHCSALLPKCLPIQKRVVI